MVNSSKLNVIFVIFSISILLFSFFTLNDTQSKENSFNFILNDAIDDEYEDNE